MRLSTIVRLIASVVIVLMGAQTAAAACGDCPDLTVEQATERADVVLQGRVKSYRSSSVGEGTIVMAVDSVVKGRADSEAEIWTTDADLGCTWNVTGSPTGSQPDPFVVTYLVFARRVNGHLQTSACAGNRPATQAQAAVARSSADKPTVVQPGTQPASSQSMWPEWWPKFVALLAIVALGWLLAAFAEQGERDRQRRYASRR